MFAFENYHFPKFGYIKIPPVKIKKEEIESIGVDKTVSNSIFLLELGKKGLNDKIAAGKISIEDKQKYLDRLVEEFNEIDRLYFTNYILLVWQMINFCHTKDILTSPSRGSCGGSLLLYCIGCIQIDPIKNDLLFSRFISAARTETKEIDGQTYIASSSLPDIDTDFMVSKRQIVIDWVKEQFPDRVCQIKTVGELKGKICLKDCYKIVEEATEEQAKEVADMIEVKFGKVDSITDTYKNNEKFRAWAKDHKKTVEIALKLEGLIRNIGMHASGVLLSDDPLGEFIPYELSSDKRLTSGFEMGDAQLFAIKLDCLGLKNLDTLKDVLDNTGVKLEDIDIYDKSIYEFLNNSTHYCGIFQAEIGLGKQVLSRLKPQNPDDVFLSISVARPGSVQYIDELVELRANNEIKRIHPKIDKVLEKTSGILIFQESLMQLCSVIAGFDPKETNSIRSAVGKKDTKKMLSYQEKFIEGGLKNGYSKEIVDSIWASFLSSADYSFNRCVAPDTLVELESGLKKEMSQIKTGDKIKAYNTRENRDHFVEVKNIYNNKVEIFEIELSDGRILKCSKDHRVMTSVGMRKIEDCINEDLEILCEDEYFKEIKGYEGYYCVSNRGRVFSTRKYKSTYFGKFINPFIDQDGYFRLQLQINGVKKKYYVHRLVAENFLPPNLENKQTINHKDGDKRNNNPDNLEWSTWTENNRHARISGLHNSNYCRGENASYSKLKEWQILEIKQKYIPRKYSQYKLALEYGVAHQTIDSILKGRIWKHIK